MKKQGYGLSRRDTILRVGAPRDLIVDQQIKPDRVCAARGIGSKGDHVRTSPRDVKSPVPHLHASEVGQHFGEGNLYVRTVQGYGTAQTSREGDVQERTGGGLLVVLEVNKGQESALSG